MIKLFGHSDDCIEIESNISEEFYASTDEDNNYIAFSNGVVAKIKYDNDGEWVIKVLSNPNKVVANIASIDPDDDDAYTEFLCMQGDLDWVMHGIGFTRKKA